MAIIFKHYGMSHNEIKAEDLTEFFVLSVPYLRPQNRCKNKITTLLYYKWH
jgi:hypothetical protein